jgi:hypothetical protein
MLQIIQTSKPDIYFLAVRPEHAKDPDEFCRVKGVKIEARENSAGTPLIEGELLTLNRLYQGQAYHG